MTKAEYALAYYHRTKHLRKDKIKRYNQRAHAKYQNDPEHLAKKQAYRDAHKDRTKQYNQEYRENHKGCGLTKEQYDAMVLEQKERCLICKEFKKLVVDHDHGTGNIRGL